MRHGHRKPAVVSGKFREGGLLPPDPIRPFGEAVVNFDGVQVRVPFAGIEPTARQIISVSLQELLRLGRKFPEAMVWSLEPQGPDDSLQFDLVAL